MAIEKIKNRGGRFGATSYTALPIQHVYLENGPNGLNWQCCLVGMYLQIDPQDFIFSIAMCADYSFAVKTIEI